MTTYAPPAPQQSPAGGIRVPQDGLHSFSGSAARPVAVPSAIDQPSVTRRSAEPRWPRLAWLAVLIGGSVLYWLVLTTMITTRNPIFFPTMLLLGSAVVPATVLTYAVRGGRRPVGSVALVVLTAVGGGLLGTLAAGTVEFRVAETVGLLPMFAVAVIEETAKLTVPILVMLIIGARDRRLGVVLGVASGMGFAILETMGYGFAALLASGSVAAADQTLLIRALLSPACHIAWTGVAMAAIWQIQTSRQREWAVVKAGLAVLGVIALHTVWNSVAQGSIVQWTVGVTSLVLLIAVLHQAHREPQVEPTTQLPPEPLAGVPVAGVPWVGIPTQGTPSAAVRQPWYPNPGEAPGRATGPADTTRSSAPPNPGGYVPDWRTRPPS